MPAPAIVEQGTRIGYAPLRTSGQEQVIVGREVGKVRIDRTRFRKAVVYTAPDGTEVQGPRRMTVGRAIRALQRPLDAVNQARGLDEAPVQAGWVKEPHKPGGYGFLGGNRPAVLEDRGDRLQTTGGKVYPYGHPDTQTLQVVQHHNVFTDTEGGHTLAVSVFDAVGHLAVDETGAVSIRNGKVYKEEEKGDPEADRLLEEAEPGDRTLIHPSLANFVIEK